MGEYAGGALRALFEDLFSRDWSGGYLWWIVGGICVALFLFVRSKR